jgi:hypothetical protein
VAVIDGEWAPYMCREILISDVARERARESEASRLNLPPFEIANQPGSSKW